MTKTAMYKLTLLFKSKTKGDILPPALIMLYYHHIELPDNNRSDKLVYNGFETLTLDVYITVTNHSRWHCYF